MFYSHEILTGRKYGVATVWLVATLGADEARRKLNKVEIQKVNVPKACETITSTEIPLALRLQSNLLFGVSKVYSQQCAFVLNDAEQVRSQVRNAMDLLRSTTTTTTRSHVAKHDRIALSDDPAFNVELHLLAGMTDMDDFGLAAISAMPDSNLQSMGIQSTQHSIGEEVAILSQQMQQASESDFAGGAVFRSRSASRLASLSHNGSAHGTDILSDLGPGALLDDAGFTVLDDGTLQDASVGFPVTTSQLRDVLPASIQPLDTQELSPTHNEYDLFPDAQALSPRQSQPQGEQTTTSLSATSIEQYEAMADDQEQVDDAVTAAAPSRVRRQRRALPLDTSMELRNQDLSDWANNYVQNMQQDASHRFHQRNAHTAKMNAQFWLNSSGLLGFANLVGGTGIPAALQMFTVPSILAAGHAVAGSGTAKSSKRSHSSSAPDESGRVRLRLTSQDAEQGRAERGEGQQVPQQHDNFPQMPFDDLEMPLEIGREAATPLADRQSSQMPWNVSRGSSIQRRLVLPLGDHRSSSFSGAPFSQGIRSSVAPSPLLGYHRSDQDVEMTEGETFQLPMDDTIIEDVPADGHPSQLDLQGLGKTTLPWAGNEMDTEQMNFVAYLMDRVDEKRAGAGEGHEDDELEFEDAFPPDATDNVVASQALMHVLALNGKGVLSVTQETGMGFRPISLRVVGGVALT